MKKSVINEIKGAASFDFALEKPKDKGLAHYAMPTFSLAKQLKKSPVAIAAELASKFENSEVFEATALNGYINFKLKPAFLDKFASASLANPSEFAKGGATSGEKILLEYVSANPTGPLHIGHVRGAVFGDTLARVGLHIGENIATEYYINDAGNQIELLGTSISLWARENLFGQSVAYPEKFYRGDYIKPIAKEALEKFGKEIFYDESRNLELAEFGKDKVLVLIKQNLADAQIFIENWASEKSYYDKLPLTLDRLKSENGIYESEGKIWLKSSEVGDEKDRVIVREDGRGTYLAGDVVYHDDKFRRGFDRCINIWGADHHGYVARVKAAIAALGDDPERLTVLLLQMVSLYRDGALVKLSKRTGETVTLRELMEEVGVVAARYFFLMRSLDSQLDFDLDLAKKRTNENPVYYIQYAHARISSIFRQADEAGIAAKDGAVLELLTDETEIALIKKIAAYPEEIARAAAELAPQRIARYSHELAGAFHSFYNKCRIIGQEPALASARLALVSAAGRVIRNSLGVLGVSAPEKM